MRYRAVLLLLLTAPSGCDHPINWSAFAGNSADGGPTGGPPPTAGPPDTASLPPVTEQCAQMTGRAFQIIMSNCSQCHAPTAPGDAGGGFNFITDLTKLVNGVGPRQQTLLKPRDPEGSFIFYRIATNAMPPAQITKRPTQDTDVPALRDFIMTCLPPAPPYPQWPELPSADAGAPAEPIVPCTAGNTCADGGCCVFGACRKNGQTCGESLQAGTVPGVCTNGSCVDNGNPCGKVEEACCYPMGICTAPGAICGLNTGKCIACGGEGQECCKFGGACKDVHNVCAGGGGGGQRPFCAACGLPGQICCGEGTVTRKKCDTGVCTHIVGAPGLGDYCPGAAPTPPVPPT